MSNSYLCRAIAAVFPLVLFCGTNCVLSQITYLPASSDYIRDINTTHALNAPSNEVIQSCRGYCIDLNITCYGPGDPLATEVYDYRTCLQSCVQLDSGNDGDAFGNTRSCRNTHVRLAKVVETINTDETALWHCAQITLLGTATAAAKSLCGKYGCNSCTDECVTAVADYSGQNNETAPQECLGGKITDEISEISDLHLAMCDSVIHHTAALLTHNYSELEKVREPYGPLYKDSDYINLLRTRVLPHVLNSSDFCPTFVQFDLENCYCRAHASRFLQSVFGPTFSEFLRLTIESFIPATCGFTPSLSNCLALEPAIPQIDVGKCVDIISSTVRVCSLDFAAASCCGAMADLDHLGCFCDDTLPVLKAINDNIGSLVGVRTDA